MTDDRLERIAETFLPGGLEERRRADEELAKRVREHRNRIFWERMKDVLHYVTVTLVILAVLVSAGITGRWLYGTYAKGSRQSCREWARQYNVKWHWTSPSHCRVWDEKVGAWTLVNTYWCHSLYPKPCE